MLRASLLGLLFIPFFSSAQDSLAIDKRYQYPGFLSKAFFGVSVGYLNYPFSNQHLEAGFSASGVQVPNLGVKITLLGYRFNKNLAAQITYMRPVWWVEYRDVNGDKSNHSVFMNVAGLTLNGRLPLGKKFSLFGEAGLSIVSRNGFDINGKTAVQDFTYGSYLLGGGVEYRINKKWDLIASATYTPANNKFRQPQTTSAMAGFRYNMQPIPDEVIRQRAAAGYYFPKHLVQIGYTTDALGYGVNETIDKTHLFWGGGDVSVKDGFSISYQRNLFHTRKVFAFDIGFTFSHFRTRRLKESFITLSAYPVFRFNLVRAKAADFYFSYILAGPTYISKSFVDGVDTGEKFTFRDYIGIGTFAGKNRKLNAEINIGHFSNGNLFPDNGGFRVPLSFNVGYTF